MFVSRLTRDDSLFCFKLNLKALFLTSGDEKIGGLFAEAESGVGGLKTLPGDSGFRCKVVASFWGGSSKSENLRGLLSSVSSEKFTKY